MNCTSISPPLSKFNSILTKSINRSNIPLKNGVRNTFDTIPLVMIKGQFVLNKRTLIRLDSIKTIHFRYLCRRFPQPRESEQQAPCQLVPAPLEIAQRIGRQGPQEFPNPVRIREGLPISDNDITVCIKKGKSFQKNPRGHLSDYKR